jgi:hypothetical protein
MSESKLTLSPAIREARREHFDRVKLVQPVRHSPMHPKMLGVGTAALPRWIRRNGAHRNCMLVGWREPQNRYVTMNGNHVIPWPFATRR